MYASFEGNSNVVLILLGSNANPNIMNQVCCSVLQ